MEVTATEARQIMAKYDADGGGTLDVTEFDALVTALREFQQQQQQKPQQPATPQPAISAAVRGAFDVFDVCRGRPLLCRPLLSCPCTRRLPHAGIAFCLRPTRAGR